MIEGPGIDSEVIAGCGNQLLVHLDGCVKRLARRRQRRSMAAQPKAQQAASRQSLAPTRTAGKKDRSAKSPEEHATTAMVSDDPVVTRTVLGFVMQGLGWDWLRFATPHFESHEDFRCCGVEAGFNLLQF